MFLAEIFARRVKDDALISSVDEAWKAYVQSLIEWNADLMIYIVGLDTYYDQRKSRQFEDEIQASFSAVDALVRAVYMSPHVKNLQKNAGEASPGVDKGPVDEVFSKTNEVRSELYFFVRCFRKEDQTRAFGC